MICSCHSQLKGLQFKKLCVFSMWNILNFLMPLGQLEDTGAVIYKTQWTSLLRLPACVFEMCSMGNSGSFLHQSVQSLSCVQLFVTPRTASLFITNSWSLLTHVHWVSDAIQFTNPLSSPSPPALNLSQHEGLFKWVSSSHEVARVLEFQLQHQSFQWIPRTDLL